MARKTVAICTLALGSYAFDVSSEDGLNLLQLRAVTKVNGTTHSRTTEDPGQAERAQCPHELEAELEAQGSKRYGCNGRLSAESTVTCSWWGDPHITHTFPTQDNPVGYDIFSKSGLFRAAAAADGSWEVQIFNCGTYASAMAARLGKNLVEVWVDADMKMQYKLNGVSSDYASLPLSLNGLTLEQGHRSIREDNLRGRVRAHAEGTCFDDPGGQVNIDIAQGYELQWNLNMKIEASVDAVTMQANDQFSLCSTWFDPNWKTRRFRHVDWNVKLVAPEDSLFTIGSEMCAGCNSKLKWGYSTGAWGKIADNAKLMCAAHPEKEGKEITLGSVCKSANNGAGIDIDDAAAACASLQEQPAFYRDCQIDYCLSDGDINAALTAAEEETLEHPVPVCVSEGACDPASKCCDALKDEALLKLDNVVSNEMCSGGELRFGRAMSQNGQSIDLVVKPVGDMNCGGKLTDAKFGSKSSQIAFLAVRAGTSQVFEFSFVQEGTNTPVAPKSLMMSFLDLDQGKKGKQQESVEMCGGMDAIVTDDNELDIDNANGCIKVTSTTHGTGSDNPESVESMSQSQRARVVAYEVKESKFTATLAVSKSGRNARKFQFAGHPSVACVLK